METPCYIINSIIFIKRKSQKIGGGIFDTLTFLKQKPPTDWKGV